MMSYEGDDVQNSKSLQEPLLNERETAKLLRVSVQLLRKWRAKGMGPEYSKLGGKLVRYDPGALIQWIAHERSTGPETARVHPADHW
jgi:predicted DNA-binding transcriptional regulator AlpA